MTALKKPIKIEVEDLDALEEEAGKEKKPGKTKIASADVKKQGKAPSSKKHVAKKPGRPRKLTKKSAPLEDAQTAAAEKNAGVTAATAAKIMQSKNEPEIAKKIEPNQLEKKEKPEIPDTAAKEEKKEQAKPLKKIISKSSEEAEALKFDDDPVMKVVSQVKKEKEALTDLKEEEEIAGTGHSLKLYRRIAYFFILLTIALIAAVLYFSLVKVRITLVPNQERLSNNMIFDLYDLEKKDVEGNAIKGIVKEIDISFEKDYPATGEEVIGREVVGEVEIINNYTKNQPLVASTRISSSDGGIYRLKNTINVPAGGKIEAEVYADEPSQEAAIGPAKFTIPGLWAGLQDKIYAESSKAFVYRQKIKKYIKEEDIENGINDLKQQLLVKTKEEVSQDYKDYGQILYKINEDSVVAKNTAKAGEEKENFPISMKAKVVVVAFQDEKTAELARQKFQSSLPQNKEVISFDEESIIYTLNNYDLGNKTATINSNFIGKVTLKENSQIVDIDKILGLNDQQLKDYLSGLNEISGFEIEYYPSFIKHVPRLVDRISVEIKR